MAKDLFKIDGFRETVNLARSFGVFYDRDTSLLASAIYTEGKNILWRVNIYPGLVKIGPAHPSLTFITTRDNEYLLGLTVSNLQLPIGLAARVGRGP